MSFFAISNLSLKEGEPTFNLRFTPSANKNPPVKPGDFYFIFYTATTPNASRIEVARIARMQTGAT